MTFGLAVSQTANGEGEPLRLSPFSFTLFLKIFTVRRRPSSPSSFADPLRADALWLVADPQCAA